MENNNNTKLKVIVRGPALSRSGYGHNTRFLLRALKTREDALDVFLINTNWGHTGWLSDDSEERIWLDQLLVKTIQYQQQGGQYDLSFQVTIPQEWEKMAPINIGYTAGVETTKISPVWVEKSNFMDRIIVVSEHTKYPFVNTFYQAQNKDTGEVIPKFGLNVPIDVVHYANEFQDISSKPSRTLKELGVDTKFNFFTFAQWGIRKNLENTVKWFVETFFSKKDVGLVVKTFMRNYSTNDVFHTKHRLKSLLKEYEGRQCKVYFLHGEMSDDDLYHIYDPKQINAFINLSHGEGFGLPIFEAACRGIPVISTDWGGQCDFLYMKDKIKISRGPKSKKVKTKEINRAMFAPVAYNLSPVQKEAVWENVIIKDSMWAYPEKESYMRALRAVYKDHLSYKETAKKLQVHLLKNFTSERKYSEILDVITKTLPGGISSGLGLSVDKEAKHVFVSDFFVEDLVGGAEMSFQSLINSAPDRYIKVKSAQISDFLLDSYKDRTWIFGNIAQLEGGAIPKILERDIKFNIVEFDYKFCDYRNPQLHLTLEDEECGCETRGKGAMIKDLYQKANKIFFMSDKQREYLVQKLELDEEKTIVLSSIFDQQSLNKVEFFKESFADEKEDKWAIVGSHYWVKGAGNARKYCKENELDCVELKDMEYDKVLETLATSKGLVFLPEGQDTCPRVVIEAKLLGCELILNDFVLHKDEEWFNQDDPEKILEYLRSVANRFWSNI